MLAAASRAAAGIGWDRAGDLLPVDLAEGRREGELAGLAVGGGGGLAAILARGETAIDAIAVGVVGDDEDTLFRVRGRRAQQDGEGDRGEEGSHIGARGS